MLGGAALVRWLLWLLLGEALPPLILPTPWEGHHRKEGEGNGCWASTIGSSERGGSSEEEILLRTRLRAVMATQQGGLAECDGAPLRRWHSNCCKSVEIIY
nr:uncharacterized protein LOC115846208 [Globicephala melas]